MPLIDLNNDILLNIALYLSAEDILSLSLTSKLFNSILDSNSTYHLLYVKTFGCKPTPLSLDNYNWKDLFKLRSSPEAEFYTWGSPQLGRLGYLIRDIQTDHVTSGYFKNVHTPTELTNFSDSIVTNINANGFCFQILTSEGDLYYTGNSWRRSEGQYSTPGPFEKSDYRASFSMQSSSIPFIENVQSRRLIRRPNVPPMPGAFQRYDRFMPISTASPDPDRTTNPALTRPPEELDLSASLNQKSKSLESNLVTKLELPKGSNTDRKIVSISSGREHILALDNHDHIYSWDTGNTSKVGVHVIFPKIGDSLTVTKISAGWNLSACHFNGIGIVVWYARSPVTREEFESGTMRSEANYVIIPNTSSVIDFIACFDYVLFIDKDSKLQRFSIHAQTYASQSLDEIVEYPEPEDEFNQWLDEHNQDTGKYASFTKLSGCFKQFAIFTDDGSVLLGSKDSQSPTILPELQNEHIVEVVMGDYHRLALTDDGSLYSWGTESNNCGCLGLGHKEEFIEQHSDIAKDLGHNKGMTVSVPSIVKNPTNNGKWLAVAAAGWHSCGIYLPQKTI